MRATRTEHIQRVNVDELIRHCRAAVAAACLQCVAIAARRYRITYYIYIICMCIIYICTYVCELVNVWPRRDSGPGRCHIIIIGM